MNMVGLPKIFGTTDAPRFGVPIAARVLHQTLAITGTQLPRIRIWFWQG